MERKKELDIIKGCGILLMVIGHSGFPFWHFIYLFHMPIFFIASGYVFNSSYSQNYDSIKTFVYKRIKSLWLPFFTFSSFFLLLWNVFVKINLYTGGVKHYLIL